MDRSVNFLIKMLFYKMFSRIFLQKIYLENSNSVTTGAKVGQAYCPL